MSDSKRSSVRVRQVKFDKYGAEIAVVPRAQHARRSTRSYVIVGLPLIGVIALLAITGALTIRRRPTPQIVPTPTADFVPVSGKSAPQPVALLRLATAPTAAPSRTASPTMTATAFPTASPSVTSSATPSASLTASATLSPTVTLTASVTPSPTISPLPPFTCADPHGQVLKKFFISTVAQDTVPYRVYLPPCYAGTNRRYPYVILLHGVGDDETEWTDSLGVNKTLDQGIADGTLPPMILIMPNGGDLEYNNYFADGASFESFLLSDLMPEIENTYCTWNAQPGRALAGISRGGFWVFEIGFRHPTLFGALAGHSAYFDPSNAPAAYNPLNLAQAVIFTPHAAPRLWLDVGAGDPETRQNLDVFAQTLTARHIDPGYTVYPTGEHVAAYWQSHLTEYLTFYGKNWPRDPLALAVCKT